MPLNRVRAILLVTAALALLPVASSAGAPPRCWMGSAGCKHSLERSWRLTGFTGSVTATRTVSPKLTCADTAGAQKKEILSGTYEVDFALDRTVSKASVGFDRTGAPKTANPLRLRFKVTRNTHEQVRVLTSNAEGTGCTEQTNDCGKAGSVPRTERLNIFTRDRRVYQDFAGAFINPAFAQCGADNDTPSLLPSPTLQSKFMVAISPLANFNHRSTHVTVQRDRDLEDNTGNVAVKGRLTYVRVLHECTYYGSLRKPSAIRCRDTRG